MEYKSLTKDFKIPVIGLGTWGIGGYLEPDYTKDKELIKIIKEAIALGYSHIDTAELYGAGHTEELIGEGIKGIDRSEIIITSKVFQKNLHYQDVINSCTRSLERLRTDYIDIYLIHAPNPEIPIDEPMRALDYLVEQGFVRFIGISNFSVQQIIDAQKFLKNKLVINQIPYNLCTRDIDYKSYCSKMESEIIPYCQKNDLIITAYRPIERGILLDPHPVLNKLSEKYGKTKGQIAISWLVSKKNIITIPKSTNIKHLKENLGAIDWDLDEEDKITLDSIRFDNKKCIKSN